MNDRHRASASPPATPLPTLSPSTNPFLSIDLNHSFHPNPKVTLYRYATAQSRVPELNLYLSAIPTATVPNFLSPFDPSSDPNASSSKRIALIQQRIESSLFDLNKSKCTGDKFGNDAEYMKLTGRSSWDVRIGVTYGYVDERRKEKEVEQRERDVQDQYRNRRAQSERYRGRQPERRSTWTTEPLATKVYVHPPIPQPTATTITRNFALLHQHRSIPCNSLEASRWIQEDEERQRLERARRGALGGRDRRKEGKRMEDNKDQNGLKKKDKKVDTTDIDVRVGGNKRARSSIAAVGKGKAKREGVETVRKSESLVIDSSDEDEDGGMEIECDDQHENKDGGAVIEIRNDERKNQDKVRHPHKSHFADLKGNRNAVAGPSNINFSGSRSRYFTTVPRSDPPPPTPGSVLSPPRKFLDKQSGRALSQSTSPHPIKYDFKIPTWDAVLPGDDPESLPSIGASRPSEVKARQDINRRDNPSIDDEDEEEKSEEEEDEVETESEGTEQDEGSSPEEEEDQDQDEPMDVTGISLGQQTGSQAGRLGSGQQQQITQDRVDDPAGLGSTAPRLLSTRMSSLQLPPPTAFRAKSRAASHQPHSGIIRHPEVDGRPDASSAPSPSPSSSNGSAGSNPLLNAPRLPSSTEAAARQPLKSIINNNPSSTSAFVATPSPAKSTASQGSGSSQLGFRSLKPRSNQSKNKSKKGEVNDRARLEGDERVRDVAGNVSVGIGGGSPSSSRGRQRVKDQGVENPPSTEASVMTKTVRSRSLKNPTGAKARALERIRKAKEESDAREAALREKGLHIYIDVDQDEDEPQDLAERQAGPSRQMEVHSVDEVKLEEEQGDEQLDGGRMDRALEENGAEIPAVGSAIDMEIDQEDAGVAGSLRPNGLLQQSMTQTDQQMMKGGADAFARGNTTAAHSFFPADLATSTPVLNRQEAVHTPLAQRQYRLFPWQSPAVATPLQLHPTSVREPRTPLFASTSGDLFRSHGSYGLDAESAWRGASLPPAMEIDESMPVNQASTSRAAFVGTNPDVMLYSAASGNANSSSGESKRKSMSDIDADAEEVDLVGRRQPRMSGFMALATTQASSASGGSYDQQRVMGLFEGTQAVMTNVQDTAREVAVMMQSDSEL